MIINNEVHCHLNNESYKIIKVNCHLPVEVLTIISRYIKCEYKTHFVLGYGDWSSQEEIFVLLHFKDRYPLIVHLNNLNRTILDDCLYAWVQNYFYRNRNEILK